MSDDCEIKNLLRNTGLQEDNEHSEIVQENPSEASRQSQDIAYGRMNDSSEKMDLPCDLGDISFELEWGSEHPVLRSRQPLTIKINKNTAPKKYKSLEDAIDEEIHVKNINMPKNILKTMGKICANSEIKNEFPKHQQKLFKAYVQKLTKRLDSADNECIKNKDIELFFEGEAKRQNMRREERLFLKRIQAIFRRQVSQNRRKYYLETKQLMNKSSYLLAIDVFNLRIQRNRVGRMQFK